MSILFSVEEDEPDKTITAINHHNNSHEYNERDNDIEELCRQTNHTAQSTAEVKTKSPDEQFKEKKATLGIFD